METIELIVEKIAKAKIGDFRLNNATGNIHATLRAEDGELLICGTLNYIAKRVSQDLKSIACVVKST